MAEAKLAIPDDIAPLITLIKARMRPMSIWLFGSRARGDQHATSDWDLLVTLADDAPADLLDPIAGWRLQRESGIAATIITVTDRELVESWGTPNTLSFDLARHGRLLDV